MWHYRLPTPSAHSIAAIGGRSRGNFTELGSDQIAARAFHQVGKGRLWWKFEVLLGSVGTIAFAGASARNYIHAFQIGLFPGAPIAPGSSELVIGQGGNDCGCGTSVAAGGLIRD
ncbi:MAG TPA: hypothetical protein VN823_09380 [Stellaceae bacterium]|nr:hypothetical protein [Stellaceae bacterium]